MHSEYSVTDGIVRIDEAVAKAQADGMPALALTDGGNVFGMVVLHRGARRDQAGDRRRLLDPERFDREKPFRARCPVRSRKGYSLSNCCRAPG
jgi:DNA polymerase-3 subunit alpha